MKRIRQYLGILAALAAYYMVHEGAHWLYALTHGVFKQINIMTLGVQIDVFRDQMANTQLGWFCLVGPLATFIVAWLMVLLSKPICRMENKIAKSCCWYISIIMLCLDPLYMSVLYRLVGGGDMNGIRLLMPEIAAEVMFGIIFILHLLVLIKILLPRYTESFKE